MTTTMFNFNNTMDNQVFNNREELIQEYNDNMHVTTTDNGSDNVEYDDSSGDFNRDSDAMKKNIANEQAKLYTPMIVNEDMPDMNYKHNFVDKDNYNKFMKMKSSYDILTVFVNTYFWALYNIVITILLVLKIIEIVSGIQIIPFQVNWGIMIVSVIIYVIYRSFNRYSPVKISF